MTSKSLYRNNIYNSLKLIDEMYDVFLFQPRKKINKEVKDTVGYDNEALDEEQAARTQKRARESAGLSNGHSNGVADEHVNVKM